MTFRLQEHLGRKVLFRCRIQFESNATSVTSEQSFDPSIVGSQKGALTKGMFESGVSILWNEAGNIYQNQK